MIKSIINKLLPQRIRDKRAISEEIKRLQDELKLLGGWFPEEESADELSRLCIKSRLEQLYRIKAMFY